MDAMNPSSTGIPYAIPYPPGVATTTQATYDTATYGVPTPPTQVGNYPLSAYPQPSTIPPTPIRPPLQPQFPGQYGAPPYGGPAPYPPQFPGQPPMQPSPLPPQQAPILREESYIENIVRLNRGKLGTFYMTYSDSLEWRDRVYRGVIEAAGVDHIIISDPKDGKRYVLLNIYLDWIEFNEEINYEYPIR